ncbi:MAG: endonuclease domain-containing protein [Novosphingobium sp.]
MLRNIAPQAASGSVKRDRKLRQKMSLPEALLRRELRGRPSGLKFRRQHATGPFVLDFYCSDARLAIEVDGIAHAMGDRPARDEVRDIWLAQHGIETLRVPASDVLKDVSGAAESVVKYARSRLPLHHPAAPDGPPPRDKLGKD